MARARLLLLLLIALLVLPVLAKEKEKKPKLKRWKSGEQEGKVVIDGKEEAFVALVPKGYSTKRKWPAVLLAHGNGGKAKSFLKWVKTMAGKRPPLLLSLERCDNSQDAVGYVPKYLAELTKQFSIDEGNVYALGFSGGGFRLWDDIVCKKEALPKFRGVVLVGCGKQSFDPPDKPEKAPTVILVGDPKDKNYKDPGAKAVEVLKKKGYEVVVHEHKQGHTLPKKEIEAVFAWIDKTVRASRKKKR
ncbi:MAG: alpha/beta hydrolase [Planctomycetota bacterium]|jgi:predicted esterase